MQYSCRFHRFRSKSPGEQEHATVTIETDLEFCDRDITAMMELFWEALWEQTDWGTRDEGWSSALEDNFPIIAGNGEWQTDQNVAPFPYMNLPCDQSISRYVDILKAIKADCRRKKMPVPDYIDLDFWMCGLSLSYEPESVHVHDFGYEGKNYHVYWQRRK